MRVLAASVFAVAGCATLTPAVQAPSYISPTIVEKKVRRDPMHEVALGEEYYPLESKLLHEEGVCVVKITVHADRSISDIALTRSTGYPRLDEACLRAFASGGLLPATERGMPITSTVEIPITWKLTPD